MEELAFGKNKRVVNEDFLNWIRRQNCVVCGTEPPSDASHIKTRGSGGGDNHWNVVPMCRKCHQVWHYFGWKTFFAKHPHFAKELRELGWEWLDGRLFHKPD